MKVKKVQKFFLLSLVLFLFNFALPGTSLGQGSQGGSQEITSGDLFIVGLPSNFTLPPISLATGATTTTYSYLESPTGTLTDDTLLFSLEDGRPDGGFTTTVDVLSFADEEGNEMVTPVGSNVRIGTIEPGNTGTITSVSGFGYDTASSGPQTIAAPVDMTGLDPNEFLNIPGDLSSTVTLVDGTLESGIERLVRGYQSVVIGISVPEFVKPGTYTLRLVYTVQDSTTGGGGGGDLPPDVFDPDDDLGAEGTILLPPAGNGAGNSVDWGMQTLSATDLEDWFAIDLVGGAQLNLSTSTTEGTVTAILCEDTACNNPVAANTPSTTGRYYIRVTENSGGNARYSLNYQYDTHPTDDWDTGDDVCASATALTPTGTEQQHGLHTLGGLDAADWFSFVSSGGVKYNFNSIISNGLVQIKVYDACGGSEISSDISGGGTSANGSFFTLDLEDIPDGSYFIEISPVLAGQEVSYSLYYSTGINGVGEHSDDVYDHTLLGDDRGLSLPTFLTMTGAVQSHLAHTLSPSDVRDLFEFNAVSGNVYNFTAVNTYGDLALEILDSGFSTYEVSENESGAFNHDFIAPSTGTFYVSIKTHDLSDNDIAGYDLEYVDNGAGPAPDSNEPDNSGAEATLLVPSGDVETSTPHSLTTGTDTEDWFAFDLTIGNEYTFYTNNSTGNPICYLYSDIGGLTQVNDELADDNAGGGDDCQTVYTAGATQRYYYRIIEAGGGDATYDFNYSQTGTANAPDASDPGDDVIGGATALGTPPTAMSSGTSSSHTLSPTDTEDWYSLTLNSGTTYNFNSIADTGVTQGTLYDDAGGSNIVAQDLSSNGGASFSFDYTAPTTQTYYLKVDEQSNTNATYDLHYVDVSTDPTGGDAADPGDNSPLLTPTALGAPTAAEDTQAARTMSDTDMFDWYTVDLTAGNSYNFASTLSVGDVYVDVFDTGGTLVAADDNSGGGSDFDLTYVAGATGVHTIRVRTQPIGAIATYDFRSRCSLGCGDIYEPNDSGAQATALGSIGTTLVQSPSHVLSGTDTEDWFGVDLIAGVTYNFNSITDTGVLEGRLYDDSSGTILLADDLNSSGNNAFSFEYTAARSGTHYLRVNELSTGAAAYDLNAIDVSTDPGGNDAFDPLDNSALLTPTPLVDPTDSQQSSTFHTLNSTDIFDLYTVNLTSGNTYNFNSIGGSGDVFVDVIDPFGAIATSDDNSGGSGMFDVSMVAGSTGAYTVRVRTAPGIGGTAAYDLKYTCTSGCAASGDAYDPGDDTGLGATALIPTTTPQVHSTHTLDATDLYDWYALDLVSGTEYTFNSSGGGDTTCELYDSIDGFGDGVTQLNDSGADDDAGDGLNCATTYTAAATKTYYYRVHAFTPGTAVSYDFNYVENSSLDASDPADDTGAGATALTMQTFEQTDSGHLLSAGDAVDFFTATLTAGTTYNFNTNGAVSGDTYIEIYDDQAALNLVAEDPGFDQTANQAFLSFTPSVTDPYWIAVRTDLVGDSASYDLKYKEVTNAVDAYDPGDDKAYLTGGDPSNLGTPTVSVQTHGPHTLTDDDLYDWYEFTLTSGVNYNFNASGGNGDNYASLYSDAAGTTEVAFDDDGAGNLQFSLTYQPVVTGTYYLRVRKFGVTGSSNYTLSYSEI